MTHESSLFTDVPFDRDGKHFGYIQAPQSTNTAGWANLFIPLIVIKNGSGPTALLFGGNHGDEYEGVVTLLKLARVIGPEHVQGRIVLMPALNVPAVQANMRLSPLDGRNMNRAFPGKPDDTLTGQVAHYVSTALLPMADIVIDIHSGGRSMHFLPSVSVHRVLNKNQMRAMVRSARAWGAPYVFVYRDVAGSGLLPSYAESLGKITLGTEMGSASQYGVSTLQLVEQGVRNVLALHGILSNHQPTVNADRPISQIVASEERDDYILSPVGGIFEPWVELGDSVITGQPVGQIHFVEQPAWEPVRIHARTSGFVMTRRAIPLTQQGDCVAVIARAITLDDGD